MKCKIIKEGIEKGLTFAEIEALTIYKIVGGSFDGTLVVTTLTKNAMIALNSHNSWSYIEKDLDGLKFVKFTGKIELSNE